jgi:hypothetical protein
LGSQGLGPVQRQIEMTAAVVQFVDFATRRSILVEESAGGVMQQL